MQTIPMAGTVELDYRIQCTPREVYRAWSTQESVMAWSHPGDGWNMSFDCFGFRVGNLDVCRFGPEGDTEYVNENRYVELLPDARIVYSSTLSRGDKLQFAGTVVVDLVAIDSATQLHLIEHGLYFDPADDAEGHRAGWQHMLGSLKTLLENKHTADAATAA